MKISEAPLFDGSPIPYLKAPYTLLKSQAEKIEAGFTSLLKDVEDFTTQALKDKKLLKTLGVPEDLDPTPTPLGLHIPFARFDFLYDGQNIHGLELNTDGTSGFNVTEWCAHKAALKDDENPNLNLSMRLLEALREHKPEATEIALVDFPGVATSWEQLDLLNRWKRVAPSSHFSDPAIRSWNPGALCYRRALSWQLRSQNVKCEPFLKDWQEKKITVVGGWSSDVGMSKAWPAFLKPKIMAETKMLEMQDLEKLRDEKDHWVIKGVLSYAGKAIFRGSDLPQKRWDSCLDNALSETQQSRPWIVQRRLEIPKFEGKPFELGIYFLNGKASGYMCRWGSEESISETTDDILRPVRITSDL